MGKFIAVFKMLAQMTGFDAAITKARGAMNSVGGSLGSGLKGQVGKVFSVSAAFTMLKGSMEEVLNRAKQYNNLGKRMGIPAAEVQKLDKAAERAGINVASLSRAMQLVQKFSGEALDKSSTKAENLARRLGLSNEELLKMRTGGKEGLAMAADALMKVTDSGERATLGLQMFGEKWPEIKGFVEEGGDAIRKAGELQATWGETTQDSLTRSQSAWANMWNDISVGSAELIETFEWLIGIFRMVANVVSIVARVIIFGLVNGFDALRVGILYCAQAFIWFLSKIGLAPNAERDIRMIDNQINKLSENMEKRSKKLGENIEKDGNGILAGGKMLFGVDTGEEVKIKAPTVDSKKDRLTPEEIDAYEKALEKSKSARIDREMGNASEEEKLRLLGEQLQLLKEQEAELKKKHPERYKETADYLELQEKMAAQQHKMGKAARDYEMKLYKNRVDNEEFANKRRIAKMKAAGATEEQIEEESLKQKKEKAVRLSDELKRLYQDPYATNDDTQKKARELAEAIADAEDDVYKARGDAQKNNNGSAVVSSLQTIGGGGSVFIGGMAARQLRTSEQSEQHLKDLLELARNNKIDGLTGGTYRNNG